ncbi:MAG: tRNA pseudouridine(38-40) synthase TruA [Chitinivibrionia bacterium]|nr:tRNA pseudouridine(38-40) synthase TruA [Chitinivibrionia bacterium]
MRIFSRVEYDGTNFFGWQTQPNKISVQKELQNAISQIVGCQISIVGAGRTDAGVHAKNQGFHFDIPDEIQNKILDFDKFSYQINSVLPQTIAVFGMQKVSNDFHARFCAIERTYHYYISLKKNPLSFNYAVFFGYKLNLEKIKNELKSIIGTHSFESFCSSNNQLDNFFCAINFADIIKTNDDFFYIKISANRFLYNMVRSIVGTLVDISRGKINLSLLEIIAKKNRKFAGTTAPAKGLVLENVRYEKF